MINQASSPMAAGAYFRPNCNPRVGPKALRCNNNTTSRPPFVIIRGELLRAHPQPARAPATPTSRRGRTNALMAGAIATCNTGAPCRPCN